MLDGLLEVLSSWAATALGWLPKSPFVFLNDLAQNDYYLWLRYLNWFVPISTFLGILEMWLSCITVYYVIQIILRWIKVIE